MGKLSGQMGSKFEILKPYTRLYKLSEKWMIIVIF